jgi:thioredoxin 1
MQTSHVPDITLDAFDADVLRASRPVLVECSADWCPPCRMMEPVVAELATTLADELTTYRLDVDREQDISIRYSVMSMPTLLMFSGGRVVDRLVGFSTASHVRRWVTDSLRAARDR